MIFPGYNNLFDEVSFASHKTKPGFFPFSKLPNPLSICNAFAPFIVAHFRSISMDTVGKC